MYAHWIIFLGTFSYLFVQNNGPHNRVVDALSQQTTLLTTLSTELVGCEAFKDQYINDLHFAIIWTTCTNHEKTRNFHIFQVYLFKGHQLCVPRCFFRTHLLHELDARRLANHISHDKTISLVEERF